jgi:hypothetical protein
MKSATYWLGYTDATEGRESAEGLLRACCEVGDADSYASGFAAGIAAVCVDARD